MSESDHRLSLGGRKSRPCELQCPYPTASTHTVGLDCSRLKLVGSASASRRLLASSVGSASSACRLCAVFICSARAWCWLPAGPTLSPAQDRTLLAPTALRAGSVLASLGLSALRPARGAPRSSASSTFCWLRAAEFLGCYSRFLVGFDPTALFRSILPEGGGCLPRTVRVPRSAAPPPRRPAWLRGSEAKPCVPSSQTARMLRCSPRGTNCLGM